MSPETIKGYAIANRLLYDALEGEIDGEKLANLYDQTQDNPKVGMVELHHLALANGVLDPARRRAIGDAIGMVDPNETDTKLTLEEQGTYTIEWFKAIPPKTYSITEAAEMLGCSRAYVFSLLKQGRLEGDRDETKSTSSSPWQITEKSLMRYARERGITAQENDQN